MADILARLLPSIRDVRNPLAVGFTWMVVLGGIAYGQSVQRSTLGAFAEPILAGAPGTVLVGALAFIATLIGSGIVRLMDRVMQNQPHRIDRRYSPLDVEDPFSPRISSPGFWGRMKSALVLVICGFAFIFSKKAREAFYARFSEFSEPISGTSGFTSVLQDEIKERREGSKNDLLSGWYQTATGENGETEEVHRHEFDLFRRHLREETNFAALASEHLLRFSLVPPVVVGAVCMFVWAWMDLRDSSGDAGVGDASADLSVSLAGVFLTIVAIVLVKDYARTGALMRRKWRRLLEEYPLWLPEPAQAARIRFFDERARSEPGTGKVSRVGARGTSAEGSAVGADGFQVED